MSSPYFLPRHLPPTAVPVGPSALWAGLRANEATLTTFRRALARYLGVGNAFLAASGRTALYCLLQGLQRYRPERPFVLMPAYTCPALARVTLDVGLQPIFIDLDPCTFTFVAEQLENSIDAQTLAVISVHPFGIPQDVAAVQAVAHAAGAFVIEDAAQAMGARWNGRMVGTQADFGLFSLGPGKPLSTGSGGVVVARESQNEARLQHWWRALPQTTATASATAWMRQALLQGAFHPTGWWAATRLGLHRVGNHEASWGYRVRGLTVTQAGVGLALLPQLEALNAARRQKAAALLDGLETLQPIAVAPQANPIYLRLPLLAPSAQQREALFKRLWDAGIGVGRLYEKTLPAHFPAASPGHFPGADAIAARLLTLPTHTYVSTADVQRMRMLLQAPLHNR